MTPAADIAGRVFCSQLSDVSTTVTGPKHASANSWPPFHWLAQPDIRPVAEDFWRAKYDEHDVAMYNRLLEILKLTKEGRNGDQIGRQLHMNNVRKYITGEKESFLTHLRAEHDRLGSPKPGHKWLPLRLKPRGTPGDEWIQVPTEIKSFDDISHVLDQLEPTEESYQLMEQFGYKSRDELIQDRANHLGFLMGTLLGDAGKDLKSEGKFPSLKAFLVLSKAKENSERFGEFTSLTVNSALGLRMHRTNDLPASDKRYSKSECFEWLAQTSPLFAWIFHIMMGLKRGEKTTNDPLRADWLFDTPIGSQIHFLQGLSESDGWVNPGRDIVIIVASPNEALLDKILTGMGIQHLFEKQKVNIVLFSTLSGLRLPIFNERANTNNYQNLVIMANARRFEERVPLPTWFLDKIGPILENCTNYDQSCLEIARDTSCKISNQTVKKYSILVK